MNDNPEQDYFLAYLSEDELSMLVYLLKKLGFTDGKILKNYVDELYNKHKPNYTFKDGYNEFQNSSSRFEDSSSYEYAVKEIASTARTVLFSILMEHDFKVNKKIKPEYQIKGRNYRTIEDFLVKSKFNNYITASDMANYAFCPARYCISKTLLKMKKRKKQKKALICTRKID